MTDDKGQKIPYQNDLKEHLLVHLHELLVPFFNLGGSLARVRIIVLCLDGISAVMLAPLNDLTEDRLVDLGREVSFCPIRATREPFYDKKCSRSVRE
jgi:hypothetical protein